MRTNYKNRRSRKREKVGAAWRTSLATWRKNSKKRTQSPPRRNPTQHNHKNRTTGRKWKPSSKKQKNKNLKANPQESSSMKVQLKMETWAFHFPRRLRKRIQKKILNKRMNKIRN